MCSPFYVSLSFLICIPCALSPCWIIKDSRFEFLVFSFRASLLPVKRDTHRVHVLGIFTKSSTLAPKSIMILIMWPNPPDMCWQSEQTADTSKGFSSTKHASSCAQTECLIKSVLWETEKRTKQSYCYWFLCIYCIPCDVMNKKQQGPFQCVPEMYFIQSLSPSILQYLHFSPRSHFLLSQRSWIIFKLNAG